MSPIYGKWPAIVDSYDAQARMCRVRIPGITDGSNDLPHAEIEYPVGDRSDAGDSKDHTELRILVGDMVYVEFLCGDPRFPVITGHRLKREGNPTDWRRWRHANIEMTADGIFRINCKRLEVNVDEDAVHKIGGNETSTVGGNQSTDVTGKMDSTAAQSTHTASTHNLTAQTTIAGAINTVAGPGVGNVGATMRGPIRFETGTYEVINMTVTFTSCSITSNGKKIDHDHTHKAHGDGANTDPPNA